MTTIDIILIIPIAFFAVMGFIKGFIVQVATLAGLVLGIMIAYLFSDFLSSFISKYVEINETVLTLVSFTIIFVLVVVLTVILGKFIERVVKMSALSILNRIAGALLGIFKASIILSYTLLLISTFDVKNKIITPEDKKESLLYSYIIPVSEYANSLYFKFKGTVFDAFKETADKIQ